MTAPISTDRSPLPPPPALPQRPGLQVRNDPALGRLAWLAAHVCGAPMAIVHLVDPQGTSYRAGHGLPDLDDPRLMALAAHTRLNGTGTFEWGDEGPVSGGPANGTRGRRTCAAVALCTQQGRPMGTLCVMHEAAPLFTDAQRDALTLVAQQVVTTWELHAASLRLEQALSLERRAEEELANRERLYRELVDHAEGIICSYDLSGRLRTINRATGKLLGYQVGDMVGRNLREFVAAEQLSLFDQHLALAATMNEANGVLTLRRADGAAVSVACQSFRFTSGSETYVISQAVDITARTSAEEMNRRFGLALEAAPELVAVASVSGELLFLNRAGRLICGLTPDSDISHLSIGTLHPESEVPKVLAAISAALQTGASHGETLFQTHEGLACPAEFTIISPRDHNARPDFVAYILRNVSERVRYQEMLRRNERRFRDVIENVAEVLFETDTEGRWTFLNPPWGAITGFTVADALHAASGAYVHPDDILVHEQRMRDLLKGETAECVYSVRFLTHDGRVCWMEVHARRHVDGGGTCVGTIGSLRDITQQHEMGVELARAHREALDANDRLSEFLANISHEIRTPLNGVIGLASALLDTHLDSAQRDYAERMEVAADSLLSLVNGVLDLSRIEAGEVVLDELPFVLRDVVDRGLEPAFARARRKGLDVRLAIDERLPIRIVSDPGRLRQVLLNLVDNAVKFTQVGRVEVRLGAVARGGAPALLIEVADTGMGIEPERQAAVFEKFKQADRTVSRRFGGAGLGLAICRQLVTRLGGDIGVRSVVGEGATFWVLLPLQPAEAETVPEPSLPGASLSARVLVVEDNATNQIVARLMLEKAGCVVHIVADGAAAVAAALHERYDVILMDCQMPVMDGYEATERIRQGGACADVPIVAMTAHAIKGDRERCLAAGMTDYLTKPLQTRVLVEALKRTLTQTPPEPLSGDAPPSTVAAPAGGTGVSASETPQVLDLRPVTRTMGGDVARQLVNRVLADLTGYLDQLTAAADAGDWVQVARVAHALGRCVSNVYADRASGAARDLERAVKDGRLEHVETLTARLIAAATELQSALAAWENQSPRAGGAAA